MTLDIKKPRKDKKLFAGFTLSESNIKEIALRAKEQGMTKSSYLDAVLTEVFQKGE